MAGPLGIALHDYLNTSWEQARGYVAQELSQLRTALSRQWGAAFDREGVLRLEALPPIPLDDDEVVIGELPFSNLPDVTAERLLGRGEGSGDGDIQEITLGPSLEMSGTTLNAFGSEWSVLTNGDILMPELVFADGDVIMIETAR